MNEQREVSEQLIRRVRDRSRTERVSGYVELDLYRALEAYCAKGGYWSMSEAVRRLLIIGLVAEGYQPEGSAK